MLQVGWSPLPSSQPTDPPDVGFAKRAYRASQLQELEGHPAWQDFKARLKAMYDEIKVQILTGPCEGWETKQAVLHYLKTQLTYMPDVLKAWDDELRQRREAEDAARLRDMRGF